MNEILYRKTTKDDMEILMKLRLEMLREVNDLSGEYEYDENFISESIFRIFFVSVDGIRSQMLAFHTFIAQDRLDFPAGITHIPFIHNV